MTVVCLPLAHRLVSFVCICRCQGLCMLREARRGKEAAAAEDGGEDTEEGGGGEGDGGKEEGER